MSYKQKIEILHENARGCSSTGILNRSNCARATQMLHTVVEELRESDERWRKQYRNLAVVANNYSYSATPKADEIPGAIAEAEQFDRAKDDASTTADKSLAIQCSGGKLFSTACQAELCYPSVDGAVGPI